MDLNKNTVIFAGGGTGGHIYPGLAVADELRVLAAKNSRELRICWIGNSRGMDRNIVEKATEEKQAKTIDIFYGISSGKLRRYFSVKNFFDLFRILFGFFQAFHILRREKPAVLFSKGGFVSVPPCFAARILKIPVYTHECDFTLGLANKLNLKCATKMFVSFKETKNKLSDIDQKKVIVTGNPVRAVFYNASKEKGLHFLGIDDSRPVLLVLGGSSGARQINELVYSNIDFLCQHFTVIHQTGLVNSDECKALELSKKYSDYKPYSFIYSQMPDVLACADVILSRAGANSIWEAAVLLKPMILVPLCGNGTRGDQVDNAEFFKKSGAAEVLLGNHADDDNLKSELSKMLDENTRAGYIAAVKKLVAGKKPAEYIAEIIYSEVSK